jgi:hypothetical protein
MKKSTLLFAFLISVSAAQSVSARESVTRQENVVLQWNGAALQAIRNTAFAPMRAARGFAILHTCMYDAWALYDDVAIGTQWGSLLRQPEADRTAENIDRAISFAAHAALVDLFSTQQAVLFDPLMAKLGFDPHDTTVPAFLGRQACANVLEFRHADGANQLSEKNGGLPYSDYTGYVPVNSADLLLEPNHWQPLRLTDGTVQVFVAPHWGLVVPFALSEADQLRPDPPALFGSPEYVEQAEELVRLSARLNDRLKAIALYWADGPNTETPPGHWNLFAQWVSLRDRHTVEQDIKMFFILGNTLLDASIAVWDCKRFYDYVRPISAIRFLYDGQVIRAWAGPGQGTQEIDGARFRPYIPTPPFAEYTSGHSAFSASAAEVLHLVRGSGKFGASYIVRAGSSFVEPGIAPSRDVRLHWQTFEDAAAEAGFSRRIGGIHFKQGDLTSRLMGRQIGTRAWWKARSYFLGEGSR